MKEVELFSYSPADDETPSEAVIKTVANVEGCDPAALESPLYAAIDPDALDQLFMPTRVSGVNPGRVTFAYDDYEVTVRGSGTVEVRPLAPTLPDEAI